MDLSWFGWTEKYNSCPTRPILSWCKEFEEGGGLCASFEKLAVCQSIWKKQLKNRVKSWSLRDSDADVKGLSFVIKYWLTVYERIPTGLALLSPPLSNLVSPARYSTDNFKLRGPWVFWANQNHRTITWLSNYLPLANGLVSLAVAITSFIINFSQCQHTYFHLLYRDLEHFLAHFPIIALSIIMK
jgi:hypothetical protein